MRTHGLPSVSPMDESMGTARRNRRMSRTTWGNWVRVAAPVAPAQCTACGGSAQGWTGTAVVHTCAKWSMWEAELVEARRTLAAGTPEHIEH